MDASQFSLGQLWAIRANLGKGVGEMLKLPVLHNYESGKGVYGPTFGAHCSWHTCVIIKSCVFAEYIWGVGTCKSSCKSACAQAHQVICWFVGISVAPLHFILMVWSRAAHF